MLSLYLFGLGLAFALGVAVGRWWTLRYPPLSPDKPAQPKRARFRRRHYSPPGTMPRLVSALDLALRRMEWDTALVNFALKAGLCPSLSEKAVIGAGIVSGPTDYRTYQDILKRAGVWIVPRARARVRWSAGWTVGKLRRSLRQGALLPPYPAAPPPPVVSVSHARQLAD